MNPEQLFGDYAANLNKQLTKTPLEGLKDVATTVNFKAGCNDTKCTNYTKSDVMMVAANSDATVVCLGTGVFILLPSENEVCEGYVFTGVCLSTGGGVSAQGVSRPRPGGGSVQAKAWGGVQAQARGGVYPSMH